ncbi:tigger transposable element-derived protein 1-like [Macrobrachium nipponense]|uniref:tigger transposable element-derived protein 1-like n=1 Tax=Macrobrachium nipponense TaxID=159736 RepID=UPI0030C8146C
MLEESSMSGHKPMKDRLIPCSVETQDNQLLLKCLLIMDNAPAHPPGLDEFKFITVKFLPPNTTPLIQPMDHQIILNFKKLYTKASFQTCFEDFVEFEADPTLVVESIVSLGKSIGSDVSGEEVEELVDTHGEELTAEELQDLQQGQQQMANEESEEGEEEEEEEEREDTVPISLIKEMFTK